MMINFTKGNNYILFGNITGILTVLKINKKSIKVNLNGKQYTAVISQVMDKFIDGEIIKTQKANIIFYDEVFSRNGNLIIYKYYGTAYASRAA